MQATNIFERPSPTIRLPDRGELLTRLFEKYGIPQSDVEGLDSARLMRVVDTMDFLARHLPRAGAVDAARATLRQLMANLPQPAERSAA